MEIEKVSKREKARHNQSHEDREGGGGRNETAQRAMTVSTVPHIQQSNILVTNACAAHTSAQ